MSLLLYMPRTNRMALFYGGLAQTIVMILETEVWLPVRSIGLEGLLQQGWELVGEL